MIDRLRKTQAAYRDAFPTERRSGCGLWLVTSQEDASMITAMALTEGTEGAVFDDLFFPLLNHRGGETDYPAACAEEIREQLAASSDAMLEAGLDESLWVVSPHVGNFTDVARYAAEIARQLPLADRAVLFFHPQQIGDHHVFTRQFQELLDAGIPEGAVITVCAGEDHPLFTKLTNYKEAVTVLQPDLRMDEAASDVLATGDADNPNVQFNQLYAEMTKAGGRGDLTKMNDYAERALTCADEQPDYEHVGVTVLMAKASILMAHKSERDAAIQAYQRASARARAALATQGDQLRPLLVQAILGEANGYYYKSDYTTAAGKYEEAAEEAQGPNHAYLRYECLRMTVDCYTKTGHHEAAYRNGTEALEIAETLPDGMAAQSTLPYLGEQLLDLADHLNRTKEKLSIEQKLRTLLGKEDWRP